MTTAAMPTKEPPESAALRAAPPSVVRLNRRTLSIVVGVLSAAVLGVTLWSLQSVKRERGGAAQELHNIDRVSKAESLGRLPADYSKNVPQTVVPILGPPLPGDLGRPILRAEQATGTHGSRNDDEAHAERVNKIREMEEAAKAPVVFKRSGDRVRTQSIDAGPSDRADPKMNAVLPVSAVDAAQPASVEKQSPVDPKHAFLERPRDSAHESTNRLQPPSSPYQVMAGTIIPAALINGINSDLPGPVIASVTEPVYDTATGRYLLIPQGTRLIGQYDSQVSFGQRRVLLIWSRLILPDTSSISLDRLPGLDAAGNSGLEDGVDRHWGRIFAGAAMSTMLGIAAELAAPQRGTTEGLIILSAKQSAQDTVNEVGKELTKKNLDIRPTLTVRPGFLLRVMVGKDIVLRPYQPIIFSRNLP